MKELRNDKLGNKCKKLYYDILNLKKIDINNYYCANLLDWFDEVVLKNTALYKSKKIRHNKIKSYIRNHDKMYIG